MGEGHQMVKVGVNPGSQIMDGLVGVNWKCKTTLIGWSMMITCQITLPSVAEDCY